MRVEIDEVANAAYVYIDESLTIDREEPIDRYTIIDFNEYNKIVGIEFLQINESTEEDLKNKALEIVKEYK